MSLILDRNKTIKLVEELEAVVELIRCVHYPNTTADDSNGADNVSKARQSRTGTGLSGRPHAPSVGHSSSIAVSSRVAISTEESEVATNLRLTLIGLVMHEDHLKFLTKENPAYVAAVRKLFLGIANEIADLSFDEYVMRTLRSFYSRFSEYSKVAKVETRSASSKMLSEPAKFLSSLEPIRKKSAASRWNTVAVVSTAFGRREDSGDTEDYVSFVNEVRSANLSAHMSLTISRFVQMEVLLDDKAKFKKLTSYSRRLPLDPQYSKLRHDLYWLPRMSEKLLVAEAAIAVWCIRQVVAKVAPKSNDSVQGSILISLFRTIPRAIDTDVENVSRTVLRLYIVASLFAHVAGYIQPLPDPLAYLAVFLRLGLFGQQFVGSAARRGI